MGWIDDIDGHHEGYLVACVQENGSSIWRELSYPNDKTKREDIKRVQVGCDCGWRSPRIIAPYGTRFLPFCVALPERDEQDFESAAIKLWRAHLAEIREIMAAGNYYETGIGLDVATERRARLGLTTWHGTTSPMPKNDGSGERRFWPIR